MWLSVYRSQNTADPPDAGEQVRDDVVDDVEPYHTRCLNSKCICALMGVLLIDCTFDQLIPGLKSMAQYFCYLKSVLVICA